MTIYKNILSKKLFLGVSASSLLVLAACAGATSFMDRAHDFAMGTWKCSAESQPFTVGVKPDGTALFKGGSANVYQLTWRLDGGKLELNGPAGSDESADINVADLENGTLTHTDTSAEGAETFIGGADGALSSVKWDFEKRTVSFQADGGDGFLGDVVTCNKTSDEVTLTMAPVTDTTAELTRTAQNIEELVRLGAAFTPGESTPDDAAVMQEWKKQLSRWANGDEKLDVTFLGEGSVNYMLAQGVLNEDQFGDVLPDHVEFAQGDTRVCMTLAKDLTQKPTITSGECVR
jgi:hypothetical protein